VTAALREILAANAPQFLLIDPRIWGAMLAAEASGVAWGTIAHNPLCFRGTGLDPRGPGMPPPCTASERLALVELEEVICRESSDHLWELNRVRACYSLPALQRLTDLYTSPPLILAATAEPFEYRRTDWPDGLVFVGPLLWDPPDAGAGHLSYVGDRPLILVSGSTVPPQGEAKGWADTVLGALSTEAYDLLATLPTEQVRNFPTGSIRTQRSPIAHSKILPQVACVICHGGPGIVHKALWYGVPVVAVPFAFDRYEVAQRVECSRVGISLPLSRLSTSEVRDAVGRAIQSRQAAVEMGNVFRRCGGPEYAADLVEARLR
jgi:UDP:flavonoid glycosyltransferase YjiC (YdhE family)